MWIMGELEFGNNSVNVRGARVTMLSNGSSLVACCGRVERRVPTYV